MRKFVVVAAVCFGVSVCVAQQALRPNLTESESVSARTTSTRDDFKKLVNFKGPNLFQDGGRALFLRATKFDKSSELTVQLYFRDQYDGEWRFYNSAYDIDGNKLDFLSIDRKVDTCGKFGCRHFEDVGITVTRDYLDSRRDRGIKLKVSGRAGEAIVDLPPGYIQGFLQRLDAASDIQSAASKVKLPSELTSSEPISAGSAYVAIAPSSGVLRDGISWTWPAAGKVVSIFDSQAALKGVDIAVESGAPVVAAASGKVLYVGKEANSDKRMLLILHNGGAISAYFHMDVVVVKAGEQVNLGQKLADLIGDTERKIHFEIKRNGRPIDPVALIQ